MAVDLFLCPPGAEDTGDGDDTEIEDIFSSRSLEKMLAMSTSGVMVVVEGEKDGMHLWLERAALRCAYEWTGDVEVGPRPVAGRRLSHHCLPLARGPMTRQQALPRLLPTHADPASSMSCSYVRTENIQVQLKTAQSSMPVIVHTELTKLQTDVAHNVH